MESAETMVIHDLDDADLVGALDRLGQFVVVHENQLSIDRLKEVGFREDADRLSAGVEDREGLGLGGSGDGLDVHEPFVVVEGQVVLADRRSTEMEARASIAVVAES